jgi:hypothetical protein
MIRMELSSAKGPHKQEECLSVVPSLDKSQLTPREPGPVDRHTIWLSLLAMFVAVLATFLGAGLVALIHLTSKVTDSLFQDSNVGASLQPVERLAYADETIGSLVPLFADGSVHHIPVVDEGHRVIGIISRSDMIAALYQAQVHALPLV